MTIRKTLGDKIHKKVISRFEYVHDKEQYDEMEHWTSHADDVLEGNIFQDDCDGFAFTCCELLIKEGLPKEDVMFIVCHDETGSGHAVCGIQDGESGKTWILDNRANRVYDWTVDYQVHGDHYEWNFFMKFDEPGQWYEVEK